FLASKPGRRTGESAGERTGSGVGGVAGVDIGAKVGECRRRLDSRADPRVVGLSGVLSGAWWWVSATRRRKSCAKRKTPLNCREAEQRGRNREEAVSNWV